MNIKGIAGRQVLAVLILTGFLYPSAAGVIRADSEPIGPKGMVAMTSLADSALIAVQKAPKLTYQVPAKEIRMVHITAYSSTPEETDDTPFTTATGSTVHDGIIAANFLPFGTKVRIPAAFGNKVFVVEDRMHPRMTNSVDVWMPSKSAALQFGVKNSMEIEILN
jgi:3D (Asp-Asp-Asp) domain-containing protein